MITKAQLITTLEGLPENLSIDLIIDKMIFIEKVQRGLDDSKAGRIFTKDQAKRKLKKWLK